MKATNLSEEDLCYVPSTSECPESYVTQAVEDIDKHRIAKGTMVLCVYFVSLFTNSVAIVVFNQRKFRRKFIAGVMTYMYLGNIGLLTAFSVYYTAFYLRVFDFGSHVRWACKVIWFMMRWGSSFVTWILSVITLFRLNVVVFPTKLMEFRSKESNKRLVGLFTLVFCFLINVDCLIHPHLQFCKFRDTSICVVLNLKTILYFNCYIFPMLIMAVSCVVFLIVSRRKSTRSDKVRSDTPKQVDTMNRIVVASTCLLFVSFMPNMMYFMYYKSENDVSCGEDYEFRLKIHIVAIFALLCNNTLDSVLYFVISPVYCGIAILTLSKAWYWASGDRVKLDLLQRIEQDYTLANSTAWFKGKNPTNVSGKPIEIKEEAAVVENGEQTAIVVNGKSSIETLNVHLNDE